MKGTEIAAKFKGLIGSFITNDSGVFQGSPISTLLFIIIYDKVYKKIEFLLNDWEAIDDESLILTWH